MKQQFEQKNILLLAAIVVALVTSAFMVVFNSYDHRQQFIALKQANHHQLELQIEYGRLLLERSTWTSPLLIEKLAAEKLGMQPPSPTQTIVVADRQISPIAAAPQ